MGKIIPIRPDDDAARQRIRTSLDESHIVEAAAGTERRRADLPDWRASGQGRFARQRTWSVVTFTRKAAGELKLRLGQN
jgi:hypothetical protein